MQYDYIIVGQGLAGSCMALQLLQKNKSVLVIDNPHPNTSSMIAAGIFNPITGRKLVKTWRADDIFPYLQMFYKDAERKMQGNFLHFMNIYRPFIDLEMQNEWMGKSVSIEYKQYAEKVYHKSKYPEDLFDEHGGLEIKSSGYVDLPSFILAVRNHLVEKGSYIQDVFDENKLELSDNKVKYGKFKSNRLIYCNGIGAANSELFGWLPFSLVKGEILEVSVDEIPKSIYNRGVFFLPKDDNICRIGATYEQNDLTNNVTEKAKKALTEKLNSLYKLDYKVVNQVAGVRPASKDRRPFIGIHPLHGNVSIFNGLGAKGVSLAPYFSNQLAKVLEAEGELDKEVDISRYKSLYYNTIDQ